MVQIAIHTVVPRHGSRSRGQCFYLPQKWVKVFIITASVPFPLNPECKHVDGDASRNPECGDVMHVDVIDLNPEPSKRWKTAFEEPNGMFGPYPESRDMKVELGVCCE
jgi:hypothetical protein